MTELRLIGGAAVGDARAGIAAAIGFLAADPDVARLLSAEPPPQIAALTDPDGPTPGPASSAA